MARLTVACVLSVSRDYGPDYVARLREGVAQYLPGVPFLCLSNVEVDGDWLPLEHGWPGWWSKLELFRPDIEGDLLYFDLDTMLIGDLHDIARVGRLTLLSDFNVPKNANSGVMYLPESARAEVWERWMQGPEMHIARLGSQGDGAFIRSVYGDRALRWQYIVPGQIVSYKVHVRKSQARNEHGDGTIPAGTRVVCFHGRPRPHEIGWKI